ncbi:MAG: protein translocase subunit SecD [Anaerolineales bacterium]|nr:protein translocase subunit SecD [Anaerolineales bacterium]
MKYRYVRLLIPILILFGLAIWTVLPDHPGIHLGPIQKDIELVRGLDLQGGLRVLLEANLPESVQVETDRLQSARDIVENRVNALGLYEPLVQVAGDRRILVELPGISDTESAILAIQETALLEFVEIPMADYNLVTTGMEIQTDFGLETEEAAEAIDTSASETNLYHTVMTGADLAQAIVSQDMTGKYIVAIEFTDEGGVFFADYTTSHIGELLGIVLDKKLVSAPRISEPITDGSASISGNFTYESANSLAVQLRFGSLPIPLKVVESKIVGPTLGEDSLQKSLTAGVIGLTVVMLFMALYYRLPGIVADLALLGYTAITFALYKTIPVTLTLPGIAGFVLSIGVAVDANVLIFERMKEELRNGKSLFQAIDMGWSRAWPSIRDSNISTLITCLILYWFGSTFGASIVKGFSLTLALGIIVSLFTAITVTRTFLHVTLDRIKLSKHSNWFGV